MSYYYKKKTVKSIADWFKEKGEEKVAAAIYNKNLDNELLTKTINGLTSLKTDEWDSVRAIIRRQEDSM